MRRRRPRQVEIFNFSFLDILACTIGLLIFIMVMVFILQSGSPVADAHAIIAKTGEQARQIDAGADRENQIADQLEAQLGQFKTGVDPQVVAQREAEKNARDSARETYQQKTKELGQLEAALQSELRTSAQTTQQNLRDAQAKLDEAKKRLDAAIRKLVQAKADAREAANVSFLPRSHSQEDVTQFQILYMDCHEREIVMFGVGQDGVAKELGRSTNDALAEGSDFSRIVADYQRRDKPLVLLWVRPDGVESFERAMRAMPEGMAYGYEPADADWKFVGSAVP